MVEYEIELPFHETKQPITQINDLDNYSVMEIESNENFDDVVVRFYSSSDLSQPFVNKTNLNNNVKFAVIDITNTNYKTVLITSPNNNSLTVTLT